MKRLEDKILQFFISGDSAAGKDIGKEISNDPSFNQADFDSFEKIWQASDGLKEWKVADEDDAWAQLLSEANIEATSAKRVPLWRNRAVAAALVLLVGFAMYYWLTWDPYVTHRAEVATTLVLPDSSTAEVTAGTEIRHLKPRFFAEADKREIFLEGQAVFDVVSNPAKPFEVITKLTSVDVLGTVFSYAAQGDFSETENIEGLVSFESNTGAFDPVELNPGDKVSFDGNEIRIDRFEPEPEPVVVPDPSNLLRIIDLIDILSEKYPNRFIPGPGSDANGPIVIKVNLDQDLGDILQDLDEDENIDVGYSRVGNGFLVSRIGASDQGLVPNYSYEMFNNGVAYDQAEGE